jgi:transcriptional antiterminator NusG
MAEGQRPGVGDVDMEETEAKKQDIGSGDRPPAEKKDSAIDVLRKAVGKIGVEEEPEQEPEPEKKEEKAETAGKEEKKPEEPEGEAQPIFALRTTANREDQVMDFLTSNITKKKLNVYSVIRPHGMRGYIFIEAGSKADAENAAQGIPYARGILPSEIAYSEMEHMVEPVKRELVIRKNDIVEIISGPFKRETAKITRIDEQKEEVVVELVEAAVPIPITLKIDAVKVIRRDTDEVTE